MEYQQVVEDGRGIFNTVGKPVCLCDFRDVFGLAVVLLW